MSHRRVDGTLVVAKLSRRVWGGAIYKDVTVRAASGAEQRLGTLLVLDPLTGAIVPGTRGRFYVYDVAGSKGLHGFRSSAGTARAAFPRRWEAMAASAGVINLAMAAAWLLAGGNFALWSTAFGTLLMTLAIIFHGVRRSSLAAFAADHECCAPVRRRRAAPART